MPAPIFNNHKKPRGQHVSELMQYSHEHTRALYAAVSNGIDNHKLNDVILLLDRTKGTIGNAELSNVQIRDGRYFFCNRANLKDNKVVYLTSLAAMDDHLRGGHNWDCDGVWLPVGAQS